MHNNYLCSLIAFILHELLCGYIHVNNSNYGYSETLYRITETPTLYSEALYGLAPLSLGLTKLRIGAHRSPDVSLAERL